MYNQQQNSEIISLDFTQTSMKLEEMRVSYKPNVFSDTVSCSIDAKTLFEGVWADDIYLSERAYLMLLNKANNPIGVVCIGIGSIDGCIVCSRKIFGICYAAQAVAFILAHNHPSGNLKPSKADNELTETLIEQSKIMKLKMLDHIILSPCGKHYSYGDSSNFMF